MKLSLYLSHLSRPVLALAVIFAGLSDAHAQQASTWFSAEKDYSYTKHYGNSNAGGSVTLSAKGSGRLLHVPGHLLPEVKGEVSAKKRVKLLGMQLDAGRIDVTAIGQHKSFDISSNNFVSNIGSNGRLKVTPRVKIGPWTVFSPTYTRNFNTNSPLPVPDINLNRHFSANIIYGSHPFSVYGVPMVAGYRIGGAADLALGFDVQPVSVRIEVNGLGRAYGYAAAWLGLGVSGVSANLETDLHFMKIEARPTFAMTYTSPSGSINVKRTAVDLFLKACVTLGWPPFQIHECKTLFNYSKGQYSWTRSLN